MIVSQVRGRTVTYDVIQGESANIIPVADQRRGRKNVRRQFCGESEGLTIDVMNARTK